MIVCVCPHMSPPRVKPASRAQAMNDLSLDPAWGNSRVWVSEVRVGVGTSIYEGTAAKQGALRGGGNQIFIPREWLVEGWFQLPKVLRVTNEYERTSIELSRPSP